MNRKSITIISIAIIVVLVGVAVFFWLKNNQASQDLPSNNKEQQDWQTYTNKTHGFSLHYPNEWQAQQPTDEAALVITNFDYPQQNGTELNESQIKITVRLDSNPNKLSSSDWVKQKVEPSSELLNTDELKTKDSTAIKVRSRTQLGGETLSAYINRENTMYIISAINVSEANFDRLTQSFSFVERSAQETNNDTSRETESSDSEQSTQPKFKTFSAVQYKELFYQVSLAGIQKIQTAPAITGNQSADQRIRSIAEDRGYRLQSTPTRTLSSAEGLPVQPQLAESWAGLKSAASREAGINLSFISGYRSVSAQKDIFLRRLSNEANSRIGRNYTNAEIASGQADAAINQVLLYSSIPGYSKHHTGYAIDLKDVSSGLSFDRFGETRGFEWISKNNYLNANRFGFIPSYPNGAGAQGPEPEPWEYVWVGVNHLKY